MTARQEAGLQEAGNGAGSGKLSSAGESGASTPLSSSCCYVITSQFSLAILCKKIRNKNYYVKVSIPLLFYTL